jgi:hypothetical protein
METKGLTAYSQPQNCFGCLNQEQWLIYGNALSNERIMQSKAAVPGSLFKRKMKYAERCECVDAQTDQPMDPECEICLGTGFKGGYYQPVCFPIQLNPRDFGFGLDPQRGYVDDVIQSGRAILQPLPAPYDLWINRLNDHRYVLHAIKGVVAPFDQPLVGELELRLLPFSSALYRLLNAHPIV